MSVQKLKLISLIGPIDKFDDIAKCCIMSESFQPVRGSQLSGGVKNLTAFDSESPYADALDSITEALELAGISHEYVQLTDYNPDIEDEAAKADYFTARLRDISGKIALAEDEIKDNNEAIQQIEPLSELDISLSDLFAMEFVDIRFGKMPLTSYNNLIYFGSNTAISFVPLRTGRQYVWGVCLTPSSQKATADAVMSSLCFERIYISDKLHGTPEETVAILKQKNSQLISTLDALYQERSELITSNRNELIQSFSKYGFLDRCYRLREYALKSSDEFYLTGWIPARALPRFKKYISDDFDVNLIIEDPEEVKNITPPTRIKNPWGIRFFEMFTQMYGIPGYNELDPTFLVAITYTLFFGIMFGDLGQGLVLSIVGALLWKLKRMQLGRIIAVIGLSSAVFGLFYGSIFGNEEIIHGFSVLNGSNTLFILLFAAGFGVFLIGLAMILNIINGVRQHDPKKYLFSPNGVCGFIFFFGNIIAALLMFLTNVMLYSPLYIILTTVIPLLLIFLATPLSGIMKGDKNALSIKWGEYITESFFELFEVMLSFLSNVISYVRIGAFAVSHAGMMLVITAMADMLGGGGKIAVLIFGNIFVMCLEGLIVGIQCLRLQFYEFFSRFYSGGGEPFVPFK